MSQVAVKKKSETNVKDTIESILVAFILAFIFRCFVVEAFVIPTGSMAPTLLGAHMDFRCSDCGYRFTAGYHTSGGETFSIPERARNTVFSIYCPNCGYHLPPNTLANDASNSAKEPLLKYGDRILVMKYTYLLNDPDRWDVVVFKSPAYSEASKVPDYSVNYIKRLVGKPGESVFVAHGDLYIAPPGADSDAPASYSVQRKPRWVQDALWRIVFDADYQPASALGNGPERETYNSWKQPWQASGGGWINNDPAKGVSAREFVFDNVDGVGSLQFNREQNQLAANMNDWMAYDQTGIQRPGIDNHSAGHFPAEDSKREVADLKLSFFLKGLKGPGVIRAVLGKDNEARTGTNEYIAEFAEDRVRLLLKNGGQEREIESKSISLTGTHEISFENVDYRIILRIDNKDIFTWSYDPNVQTVIECHAFPPRGSARIEGARAKATVQHLQLWRDIYYRDDSNGGARIERGFAHQVPPTPAKLQADEYFVLGDNSLLSLDARFWTQPVNLPGERLEAQAGVVPDRFMLGKAFFVYWPAGHKPAGKGPIALVPNFGEMRFIR